MKEVAMPITTKLETIVTIALIVIAGTTMGCIEPEYEDGYTENEYRSTPQRYQVPEPVYTATSEPTKIRTPIPTPKLSYNEIWCSVKANYCVYDCNDVFLGDASSSDEFIVPYTEYDWTDDTTTIEDVVGAMGFDYNYVEAVSEESSYIGTDKYLMQGSYIIHCDDGIVTMSLTVSAMRRHSSYPATIAQHLQMSFLITPTTKEPINRPTASTALYTYSDGQNIHVGSNEIIRCGRGCNIDCGYGCDIVCGDGCNIDCGDSCNVNCGSGCNIFHGERCTITHGGDCNVLLLYPD